MPPLPVNSMHGLISKLGHLVLTGVEQEPIWLILTVPTNQRREISTATVTTMELRLLLFPLLSDWDAILTTPLLTERVTSWLKPFSVLGELRNSGAATTLLRTDAGSGSLPGLEDTGGTETTVVDRPQGTDLVVTPDGSCHAVDTKEVDVLSPTDGDSKIVKGLNATATNMVLTIMKAAFSGAGTAQLEKEMRLVSKFAIKVINRI